MEKLKLRYPLVVEGKYDKITLSNVVSSPIVCTGGYSVFNSGELGALLRRLANETKLLILVDSDGAGKLIRAHITSAVPKDRLIQLYIPKIEGKERRKEQPSAEGTLGVEGMENQLLYELLLPYEDERAIARAAENPLSKTDLYIDGLTGGAESAKKRDALAERLGLPAKMTPNAFLAALRVLCDYEEYCALVGREEQ